MLVVEGTLCGVVRKEVRSSGTAEICAGPYKSYREDVVFKSVGSAAKGTVSCSYRHPRNPHVVKLGLYPHIPQ